MLFLAAAVLQSGICLGDLKSAFVQSAREHGQRPPGALYAAMPSEGFQLEGVRVEPKPLQDPFEIWLGGIAPSELRRTGRLGDGWLPSFCTPDDIEAAIPVIDGHSAEAGREPIDRGHFGALLGYTTDGSIPERIEKMVQIRRPDLTAGDLVVQGHDGLESRIKEFADAGATKFVLMPFSEPDDWEAELGALAESVLHLHD